MKSQLKGVFNVLMEFFINSKNLGALLIINVIKVIIISIDVLTIFINIARFITVIVFGVYVAFIKIFLVFLKQYDCLCLMKFNC